MGFASGAVSFRRFAVVGKAPKSVDQDMLDKLAEHALREQEFGVPEESEYGWCGGRHVFDGQFSFEHNVFADALSFALRIDTNKVPSEMKKAWQMMEEEAVAKNNPSGFISKNQKREVKDTIRKKIEEDLRSGKFRRSKLVPILWDLQEHTLYCTATGASFEKLAEIFERSFGLELQPLTSGSLALRLLEPKARKRDYEDMRPTRFVAGPEGEGQVPDYPWVSKGAEPKDFLGNEFLLWLWHEADAKKAVVSTEKAEVTIFIDKSLDLDCAYGQTGKDSLKGDGPSRMPEARDALRTGKLPRKFGLILDANKQQFNLTLSGESLAVSGAKLPDVEEADSPRVLFEERIAMLRDLCQILDALFDVFLKLRTTSGWESQTSAMKRWILKPDKAAAA
ncbi:MAG TPA: hypothetical protein VFE47_22345 [Tepidisphaeraceae bacterium]|jgi:hypothetical protein|nr:hypothetical protein [Tepidisphaeraceae bacterium]